MLPPEVVLDRWIKERRQRCESGFSEYVGTLNIDGVDPPSFRSFLQQIKETMNEELRLEGPNASGGVKHPPFHFDYIEVRSQIENAHAVQHAGFAFIAVTQPMVELIFRISRRLSRASDVVRLLGLAPEAFDQEILHALLFQVQMNFLVSHEYTHHIHRHCVDSSAATLLRNELRHDTAYGGLDYQAQELDADGYAVMLVLAHLLRSDRRQIALEQLGRAGLSAIADDELLLRCFFVAVLAYFCSFWRSGAGSGSLYELTHPPPPVRIKYVINVAEMWCGLNGSLPKAWFDPTRFQSLFSAAAAVSGLAKQPWHALMSVLRSPDGAEYDRQLFAKFEQVRRNTG